MSKYVTDSEEKMIKFRTFGILPQKGGYKCSSILIFGLQPYAEIVYMKPT